MPATNPISLKINGAAEALPVDTVSALLDAKGVDPARKGIAVAVNGSVVPRARWAAHPLATGDAVEIIQAKQGG
ncbi:sulfur carrier protein ThiS [Aquabacter sp. L1I39]|uniref:sulfur carrier protein ThiS n=1 Tax=Aquabacter TaxID=45402 RepID=UPI001ADA5D4A|nr:MULTISPECIES: sulfur carrier protein ThiS [unclassified Aquabacter]MDE1568832.1 sulfur carrier protein ThiS [Aquabacter sp. P-9]QTL01844.1 sulfur carrier protein ThiS [Aquabacter sp. L1I39]